MCEIAIVNPGEHSVADIGDTAQKLYDAMRTSLGIVAVYRDDDSFDYQTYKAVNPDFNNVRRFIKLRDDCYRFFIHGRLATHGEASIENAHPITIECDECDIEMLMHNGVVRGYSQMKQHAVSNGHNYKTNVDSEIIAHRHGYVPTDIDEALDEATPFRNQPSYILFGEKRILIQSSARYRLAETAEMAHGYRDVAPSSDVTNYNYVMVHA